MNTSYKYQLAKRGKHHCPTCERRTFVLYIDNSTSEALHSTVGRCDRADNCGYHYTPKQYFTDNHIPFDNNKGYTPYTKPHPKPQPSFIDTDNLMRSLSKYEQNNFVHWLMGIAGEERTAKAISRYLVGTSKNGGTCFWQIDEQSRIRTGKIIVYDKGGHRRKDIKPPVQWVHSVLKLPDFSLSQCLFGEHLLKDTTKPVAVVESEKTAVIASVYLPDMIWLACGGCGNLSLKLCESLKGRKVIVYPDAGKFNEWSEKAKALSAMCNVSVSSLIEEKASDEERKAGFDLADYLVRFSPSEFTRHKQTG